MSKTVFIFADEEAELRRGNRGQQTKILEALVKYVPVSPSWFGKTEPHFLPEHHGWIY